MIKMIILLKRRDGMSRQQFADYQRDVHAPLLLAIPEAKQFIRRFVVSYPVPAPDYPDSLYDSMVEAWFDDLADVHAFFFSENFVTRVDPDHANFINLSSVVRMVAHERVVIA